MHCCLISVSGAGAFFLHHPSDVSFLLQVTWLAFLVHYWLPKKPHHPSLLVKQTPEATEGGQVAGGQGPGLSQALKHSQTLGMYQTLTHTQDPTPSQILVLGQSQLGARYWVLPQMPAGMLVTTPAVAAGESLAQGLSLCHTLSMTHTLCLSPTPSPCHILYQGLFIQDLSPLMTKPQTAS